MILPRSLFLHPFHTHFQHRIYDEFYDSIRSKETQWFKRCPDKRQVKFLWNAFQNNRGLRGVAVQWFSKRGLSPAAASPGSLLDKPVSGPCTDCPVSDPRGWGPASWCSGPCRWFCCTVRFEKQASRGSFSRINIKPKASPYSWIHMHQHLKHPILRGMWC